MNNKQPELEDYFWPHPYPRSHPPLEVTFSNGIPESENDPIHKTFTVPYSTFKTALSKWRTDSTKKAEIDTFNGLWDSIHKLKGKLEPAGQMIAMSDVEACFEIFAEEIERKLK